MISGIGAGLHREIAEPEAHEQQARRADRRPSRRRCRPGSSRRRRPERRVDEAEDRRVERRGEARERLARAVDGERVLHEIVRAEAEELGLAREDVGHDRRGRDLDHHAERDVLRERLAARARLLAGPARGGAATSRISLAGGHHRDHDAHVAVRARAHHGAELRRGSTSGCLSARRTARRPSAGFISAGSWKRGRELVAADVEGAAEHGLKA